ncbi:recombinase XerC [Longibacter salinarum]|uniref:Recombinase XerC n=1 Tax=Longibacter salinarum TaxID=1850348 RepID=A0A2A8D2L4_9BACT|nr:tyrosine-type recombinase/integrase [Longibacter salinarum]PEN15067.1 recombinase XerC [Longibacter salinarum]
MSDDSRHVSESTELQISTGSPRTSDLSRSIDELPFNGPTDDRHCSIESDHLLVRRWLAEKSPRTQDEYLSDIEQFVDFVDLPFQYVTLGHLQEYRAHLANDHDYARSTQARKISAVKSLYTFGARIQYFAHNVGAALKTPKVRNKRAERILSEAELWAILRDETDLRNHCILRLFYASGGRVSDLEELAWRDLKERPDLKGRDGLPGGQVTFFGKGEKTRAVSLYSKVWMLIQELRTREKAEDRGGANDPVFRSQKGGFLTRTALWRVVKKAATRADVQLKPKTDSSGRQILDEDGDPVMTSAVSPHWFRHAHASHALQKGADLELVRQTLGHESIETTKMYLHVQPDKSSSYYVDEAPDFRGD